MKRRVMVYLTVEQFQSLSDYVNRTKRTKTGTIELALNNFLTAACNREDHLGGTKNG